MSAQHHCDWCMSLNSMYLLVKVFSDILMLRRCLNDIIMFWEPKGARLRGMPHTHTHSDSAYCCTDLSHQHEVCLLKQTCTPKGAARKYLTTVTDVMMKKIIQNTRKPDLNQICRTDLMRDENTSHGTQSNAQGVWPCRLPIDSLPLQPLSKSPELMSDLSKQPRRNFPSTVAG